MSYTKSGHMTYHENYVDVKEIFIASIIGLLNSFFYGSVAIMGILCAVEVCVLIYFFYRRDYISYISYYMIFLCFSMESATFVGTSQFYGFKNFRLAGLNLAVWMFLPILFVALINYKTVLKRTSVVHRKILQKLGIFTFFGIFMGLITYLANDNGFSNKAGSFSAFWGASYNYILPFLEMIVVTWILVRDRSALYRVKRMLFSTIPSLAVVFLACLVTQNYGNRGGLPSLQVSGIYFLLVCALVLVIYDHFDFRTKIVLFCSGSVILMLSLIYNASGKIVIITVVIPFLMLLLMKRKGSAAKTMFMVIFAGIAVIIIMSWLFPILMSKSRLLSIKYEQAASLFSFGGGDWLENMPESPKMRITEFMNIGAEYLKKPWFALLGKGFAGTIKDNLDLFSNLNGFDFSKWELELGAYYAMHESINCFFLVGGISGLYFIISILFTLYKRLHKSPWLLLGFLWILLYYNYHLSVVIYGIVALIVGLVEMDEERYRDCYSVLHSEK